MSTRLGIVACGALAREVLAVAKQLDHIETRFLPAKLHAYPQRIPAAVDEALTALAVDCERLFVAYADCGTAGALDKVLAKHNATRLPGAHCYALFAGVETFEALQDAEPGTFYLTDYLARQFETLVIEPLGLDRHPELRDDYFQHYTRLIYLAQTEDPALERAARAAAERLGLRYERRFTGIGAIEREIAGAAA